MEDTQNFFDEFLRGIQDTTGEDSESFRRAFENVEKANNRNPDTSRAGKMLAENPTLQTFYDLIQPNNPYAKERERMGMGLDKQSGAKRAGQVTGRIVQDISRDASRGVWWLINAPQAVADIVAETTIRRANPDIANLYDIKNDAGWKVEVDNKDFRSSSKVGATDAQGNRQKNVKISDANDKGVRYYQRPYINPGHVNSLRAPTAIAINAGLGLMNYVGGHEGYTAAVPSQDDPSKTDNVLAEVAMKYIIGRTGNLLPYDEFSKVRPDVSEDEYKRYKAFKYDKGIDLNPTDGDVGVAGILKGTTEGIHGPEVQFLGRSLPVTTSLIPTALTIAGTAAGVYGGKDADGNVRKNLLGVIPPVQADKGLDPSAEAAQYGRRMVRRGAIGGVSGLVGGMAIGNLLEQERRRRNQNENERDGSL